jgi:hypothetical protein
MLMTFLFIEAAMQKRATFFMVFVSCAASRYTLYGLNVGSSFGPVSLTFIVKRKACRLATSRVNATR